MKLSSMLCLIVATLTAGTASGQRRPATTAPSTDYEISYGPNPRYPANYDRYRNYPYTLSPYLNPVVVPYRVTRPAVPAMQPYTDLEYGALLQSQVQSAPVEAASARATTASIILQAENPSGDLPVGTAAAGVVDVLDRGTIVLDTYEEVRLRGVNVPSVSDPDEVIRYYARTGADAIRRLTQNKTVYFKLGRPERDNTGILLADVFLDDGGHLNRQILELGYGRFDTEHFLPGEISVTLQAAEVRARESKVGIFSNERR